MLRHAITWVLLFALSPLTVNGADEPLRRLIAADSSKHRIAILDKEGKTEWEYRIGPLHDLHLLSNGHLLFQTSWTRLVEVDRRSNEVVWQYDAATSNGNTGKPVEVHAFQRLDNGDTMIAESGPARIIEVDEQGQLKHQIKLKVDKPHVHHDTRLARKLANGNYLVAHENDGAIREYDRSGKVVWDYEIPLFGQAPRPGHGVDAFGNQCFAALRLPDGNTLISTGNGHSVIEVTASKEIVWQLKQNDLPEIQLAWVTTLQLLANGNLVIGNCHAGPKNPQIIEITRDRDKRVVWSFRDFKRFGDSLTNSFVADANQIPQP